MTEEDLPNQNFTFTIPALPLRAATIAMLPELLVDSSLHLRVPCAKWLNRQLRQATTCSRGLKQH